MEIENMSDLSKMSGNHLLPLFLTPGGGDEELFAADRDALEVPAEEKYRALSRALGHVTYEYCLARDTIRWSDQCQAVFGLTADELSRDRRLWLDRVHIEDRSWVHDEFRQALQEERPFDMQYRVRHGDGRDLWVRDRGVPVAGADGGRWGIVGFIKDITFQRQRDEDLRLAKLALESSINGIVLADLDGRLTYANNSFVKLSGYELHRQVLGTRVAELWQNPQRAMAIFRILQNCGEWTGHVAARRKDGSRMDVELSAHVVVDPDGRPLGYMASFIDITERREAERERQQSEKKYRLLFSSSSDALVICDARTHRIVDVNPAALAQYGFNHDEFLRLDILSLAEDPEEALLRLKKVLKCGHANFSLIRHCRRDGSFFEAEVSAATFRWKNCLLMACFIRDVTERQRLERLKDDVLSAVSHEMRTPLTAILGYTDYMLNHKLEPGMGNQFLDIIRQQSERLQELVENHLNLQQLRAGFGVSQVRQVEIIPLLHSVVGSFPNLADKYHLTVDCPAGLGPVQADEGQLHRALQNLLSNAIKYSPGGGRITLGGYREGRFVTLFVSDEGIGIPLDAQEMIFDRYFRLCPAEGPAIGGTGLGLALVKEIVKAHNGRLRVESTPGEGSTFSISLPAE
jgi:PAS domain S-box-containing protein